jgi:hypothetical protein
MLYRPSASLYARVSCDRLEQANFIHVVLGVLCNRLTYSSALV